MCGVLIVGIDRSMCVVMVNMVIWHCVDPAGKLIVLPISGV